MEISWLQLLDQRRSDCEGHEDGEQPRLHVDIAVPQVPEGKGIEEAGEYVKHEFPLKISVDVTELRR